MDLPEIKSLYNGTEWPTQWDIFGDNIRANIFDQGINEQNPTPPWITTGDAGPLGDTYKATRGGKPVSPLVIETVTRLIGPDAQLPLTITQAEMVNRRIATQIRQQYYLKWVKLWATMTQQYNLIENYNAEHTETTEESQTRTPNLNRTKDTTNDETNTVNETRNTEGADSETRTPDTTRTTTHTIDGTETRDSTKNTTETNSETRTPDITNTHQTVQDQTTTERAKYAFNATDNNPNLDTRDIEEHVSASTDSETGTETKAAERTGAETVKDTGATKETGTNTETETGTEKTTKNNTETQTNEQTTERTNTITETENETGTETTTRTHTHTYQRHGNIGVTTAQQMLEEERRLWMWDYFQVVFDDVDSVMSLPIYI